MGGCAQQLIPAHRSQTPGKTALCLSSSRIHSRRSHSGTHSQLCWRKAWGPSEKHQNHSTETTQQPPRTICSGVTFITHTHLQYQMRSVENVALRVCNVCHLRSCQQTRVRHSRIPLECLSRRCFPGRSLCVAWSSPPHLRRLLPDNCPLALCSWRTRRSVWLWCCRCLPSPEARTVSQMKRHFLTI